MGEATLSPYVDRYTRRRVALGEVRAKTARHQRCILARFAESVGRRPLDKIGRGDIEKWLAEIKASGMNANSRRSLFTVVRTFLRWMVYERHMRRDPSLGLKSPVVPRRDPEVFEQDEVLALYEYLPDARARLVVLLEVQLGLRCIEVVRLELGDVGSRKLHVRGKGGHQRSVYLVPEVRRALDDYLVDRGTRGGPLIQSYRKPGLGISPAYLSQLMSGWMYEAGLKNRPHDGRSGHALRKTMATHMTARGVSPLVGAKVIGHADLSTFSVYARADEGQMEQAVLGRTYTRPTVVKLVEDVG